MWQYEGDYTLYDLMQKKDWPYNLEPFLFGRELNIPKSPERRWLSLRTVMKQVLTWASIAPWLAAVNGSHAGLAGICCTLMSCLFFNAVWETPQAAISAAAAQKLQDHRHHALLYG